MLRRFVIHDHHASHHHHDLRLEMYGTLRSWAIPKLFPLKPGLKRLAIQVEDHSLGYINFRGTIAEGRYGAGIVKIFDRGDYEIVDKDGDHYKIVFHGKKARGMYILRMFKDNWLLWKA
jgi:DNA ligase D-like protein (predicted 3'-phosphoesterase)